MKLHDPATEREFLRLAVMGRGGQEMEPPDPTRERWRNAGAPFIFLLYLWIPAGALGAIDPRLRAEHWQSLICCILLLWAAQIGIGILMGAITRQNYHAVFVNLPIQGEHAFRWVRSRFFFEKWFPVLGIGFFCSYAVLDFSFAHPWILALSTLLQFAMTFATMMLLIEAWLLRSKIVAIWSVASLLLVGWMFLLSCTNQKIFRIGETPEWMADAILKFTWLLPPSWCMPGRFEGGGAFLALFWIAWGSLRWMKWPKAVARHLDAPQDFMGSFGGFTDEDDDEMDFISDEEEVGPVTSELPQEVRNNEEPVRLVAPLAMPLTGWVEKWILRCVGGNNKTLAGAFGDLNRQWTQKTNLMLLVLPIWLCIIWGFTRYFPETQWKETINIWIWVVSIILPVVGLMPFTNAIPRATAMWTPGAQSFPFFSALPVSARDLLRISTRTTLTRCVIMALVATPFSWLLLAVLTPQSDPRAAIWLVPALCCFWATSRPLFVWYRLQAGNRRRRGTWLIHTTTQILSLVLGICWLLSGGVGIVSGFGFFMATPSGDDLWLLPVLAGGGLIVSAVCARAVFEIYQWQLSRRHFDWLSSE